MKLHLPASLWILASLACTMLQSIQAAPYAALSLRLTENGDQRQTVRNILDEWIRFIPRLPGLFAESDQQKALQEWDRFTSRLEEWDDRIGYRQYSHKARFATLAEQARLALPLIEKAIKEKPDSPLTRKIQPSTVLEEIRQLAQYPPLTPSLYRYAFYEWTGHNIYAFTASGTRIPIRQGRNAKAWNSLQKLDWPILYMNGRGANIIIKGTREPITGFFDMEEWHLSTPFIAMQKNTLNSSGDAIKGTFKRYRLYHQDFSFPSVQHPEQYCKPASEFPGELLLQPEESPDYDEKEPNTDLLLAAMYNDAAAAAQALARGADVNTSHPQIGTPLLQACMQGNLSMARSFMEHGASLQATVTDKRSSRDKTFSECLANMRVYDEAIWNHLLQHGLKPEPACLPIAAKQDSEKLVKRLLDLGLDIEARDMRGYTAFINAALQNNKKLVQYLIERGADINAVTPDGMTALDLVYEREKSQIHLQGELSAYLLKLGVRRNQPVNTPK